MVNFCEGGIKNKTTFVGASDWGALVFKSQLFWTSAQILECKFKLSLHY